VGPHHEGMLYFPFDESFVKMHIELLTAADDDVGESFEGQRALLDLYNKCAVVPRGKRPDMKKLRAMAGLKLLVKVTPSAQCPLGPFLKPPNAIDSL
jgi:hypothetical protein